MPPKDHIVTNQENLPTAPKTENIQHETLQSAKDKLSKLEKEELTRQSAAKQISKK